MDGREELRSSTEVESLMGDEEKQQWRRHPSSLSPHFRKFSERGTPTSSHRWIISTVLQVVIIGLVGLLLLREQPQTPTGEAPQVGGDFNGKGPTIDTTILKFNADYSFVPLNATRFFDNDVLEQWKTMMPAGTGWGTDLSKFSTTSMTHQLHCIFMMARIYAGFSSGSVSSLPTDYNSHYLHCVDYLRQGVMCSADLATEPHKDTDPDDNGPLDGSWAGLHVCKDYGQVTKYLGQQISDGVRVVLPIDD
ncbi:hypothetical protein JX266_000254 [Neoarthrinium moseri]|uniref:uncharacterized protein n=1 Tax=Neoarthrinium moseri TaxID=1658444 RepID=UPI001FDDBA28|nr:uncharacterized protein JN550_003158 [Neoarthrinium moseri]KAI1855389.1 hypothetical protein JX266_000254 [Neoarthrinium moseri]KAI1873889.1 hypothetical protein JN550_003158 [Neoarthrinium moseri]